VTHEQQDEHSCGSEVVGFATAVVVAGEAQLQNMAVLRQHRGKGLARALLSQMLQVRSSRGVSYTILP
jgi:ribosomal protein S18 acetylase RimI-like enzyme